MNLDAQTVLESQVNPNLKIKTNKHSAKFKSYKKEYSTMTTQRTHYNEPTAA